MIHVIDRLIAIVVHRQATDGFSGADLAGLFRAAVAYALERYVDETLLRGGAPAASAAAAAAAAAALEVDEARRGVLEVRFIDIERALGEVRPTGSAATRAELATVAGARGLAARATSRLRGWRRMARFRQLTDRAAAA